MLDQKPTNVFGQDEAFKDVIRDIDPKDGMFDRQHPDQYFSVGASALAVIKEALAAAKAKRPLSVLDYACGYGRVLRWLRAAFPQAELLGVDADPVAAASAAKTVGCETRHLDITLARPLSDKSYDLIWVGSLITHLPQIETSRVLSYLRAHLSDGGLLVFTSHGDLVINRLQTRSRNYNLTESGIVELLETLEKSGYGFSDYDNTKGYGISAGTTARMMELIEKTPMKPVLFKEQGWAVHQDVFACRRA